MSEGEGFPVEGHAETQELRTSHISLSFFQFWQCGQWVEVVIDDRLPVVGKNFLFVHPRRGNQEFWPCLMEKAYAK